MTRPHRWPIVAAAGGALLVNLDTMVNIALPAIGRTFAVDVAEITWLVICYVLTYACLLVLSGRLSDAYGHERMLRIGLVITVAAVLGAGVAPNWPAFLAARVLQGAGAALVLGAAPAIVTTHSPPSQRARALGRFQLGVALGFAIGPPVGGLLVEWFSWRAVYLSRAPLALLLLVALLLRPLTTERTAAPVTSPRPPLDLTGTLGLGGAVAAALLALNRGGQDGWGDPLVIAGALACPVLVMTWVVAEKRSPLPALDPRLFRSVGFSVANILTALANGTMFMIWLLVPYYLLNTRGHSTITGGLLLAANPVGIALAAPLAGRLSGAWGAGRVVTGGLAVQTAGLVAVAGLGASTPVVAVAAALWVVGFGVGLFTVPNMSLVMGSIGRDEQGVAGGLAQMMRTVGVVGGVAVGSLALTALREREADRLDLDAPDLATFLPAYRLVFLGAAVVAGCAGLLALSRSADREPD